MKGFRSLAGAAHRWTRFFRARTAGSSEFDGEVTQALAQIVESIDPRLRLVRGYGRKLRPPTERVLTFLDEMISRIPAAVEFSERGWSIDPLVRFLFADVAQMKRVFGTSPEIREFFRANPAAAQVFVGLGLTRLEHHVSGTALVGEVLQQDVVQVAIGFQDRLVVGASADEGQLRRKLKARYLIFTIAEVLRQLAWGRTAADESGAGDRLSLWLRSREHERSAVEGLFGSTEALDREIRALREQLARRGRLAVVPAPSLGALDQQLGRACAVLDSVPGTMNLGIVCMRVDHTNILLESGRGAQVCFAERTIGVLPPRTVVLARVPRDQLPSQEDLFATAQQLLG